MARNEPKSTQNLTKHIRIAFCMYNSSIPPKNFQKNRNLENSIFERYKALHTALHTALQRAIVQHSRWKYEIFRNGTEWAQIDPQPHQTHKDHVLHA